MSGEIGKGGRAIDGEKESWKLKGKIGNFAIITGDFRTTRQSISKDIEVTITQPNLLIYRTFHQYSFQLPTKHSPGQTIF